MQALPALEQLEVSEAVQSSPLFDREIRIAMGTGRQGLCGLATGHGAGLGGYTLSVFGVGVLSRSGGAGLEFGGFGLGFWRHPGARKSAGLPLGGAVGAWENVASFHGLIEVWKRVARAASGGAGWSRQDGARVAVGDGGLGGRDRERYRCRVWTLPPSSAFFSLFWRLTPGRGAGSGAGGASLPFSAFQKPRSSRI